MKIFATATTPIVRSGYGHGWHPYSVRFNAGYGRDTVGAIRNVLGIGMGSFYPVPEERQVHLATSGYSGLFIQVIEKLSHEVISLPVHPPTKPSTSN